MFNIFVILAGYDFVTDAGRAIICRPKSQPHHYEQKVQKMKDFSKTWVRRGKQFEDFRGEKEQKQTSRHFVKTHCDTRILKLWIENCPGKE